jgi:hypothetical protein
MGYLLTRDVMRLLLLMLLVMVLLLVLVLLLVQPACLAQEGLKQLASALVC